MSDDIHFLPLQNFLQGLKSHILPRLKSALDIPLGDTPGGSDEPSLPHYPLDIETAYFHKELMYRHNILRINYTTYDIRRAQDTVNPGTEHRDIMLLSSKPGVSHEYRYARVLGIFHVNAIYSGPGRRGNLPPHRLEFIWVRWFELIDDVPASSPWSNARPNLDQLRFIRMDRPEAFGFIDPANILRACHIIPRFTSGQRHSDGKGLSGYSQDGKDWQIYYVNR